MTKNDFQPRSNDFKYLSHLKTKLSSLGSNLSRSKRPK
jgi:hypothetical protein